MFVFESTFNTSMRIILVQDNRSQNDCSQKYRNKRWGQGCKSYSSCSFVVHSSLIANRPLPFFPSLPEWNYILSLKFTARNDIGSLSILSRRKEKREKTREREIHGNPLICYVSSWWDRIRKILEGLNIRKKDHGAVFLKEKKETFLWYILTIPW